MANMIRRRGILPSVMFCDLVLDLLMVVSSLYVLFYRQKTERATCVHGIILTGETP